VAVVAFRDSVRSMRVVELLGSLGKFGRGGEDSRQRARGHGQLPVVRLRWNAKCLRRSILLDLAEAAA